MGGVCCDWQIVRCDGRSLLAYKQQLLTVLRLTLHVVCKEVLTLSCMLLKHVLKAVTLTYASDYRSSTSDWDLPLSDVLPIRVLAFQYYTGCYRNIKPGFPRVLKSPENAERKIRPWRSWIWTLVLKKCWFLVTVVLKWWIQPARWLWCTNEAIF